MRRVTSKASEFCQKIGKVLDQSALALKKLYPAFSSVKGKRKFDPLGECVVAREKRKKKATSTRIKPRTFFIVFLPRKTVYVPKGYARQRFAKQGRVLKTSFRRNMDAQEVKNTVIATFSSFKVDHFRFLRCGQDNRLQVVDDNNLSGDGVFELAGQGSIYVCEVRGNI